MDRSQDLVGIQIKMDQCSGENILFIRAAAKAVIASYTRMAVYRGAATLACVPVVTCPAAMEIFTAAAEVEIAIQTAVRTMWVEREYLWKLRLSCAVPLSVRRDRFPKFPFVFSDAILLSPKIPNETRLIRNGIESVKLTLLYRNLTSTAEIRKEKNNRDYTVRWTQ